MKLLISARDAGAAQHLTPVILAALADPGFSLAVCASGPALRYLQDAGFPVTAVNTAGAGLLDSARALLARHRPDAILTGLSGPDAGIDEALLAVSGTTPTFALQDFWGDVNTGFGRPADTYLVLDEAAARITRRRTTHSAATVVGSPAHAALGALRLPLLNRRYRDRQQARLGQPLLGLCSQPLWQCAGYRETLRDLLRAVDAYAIVVRPHPRESAADRRRLRQVMRRHCRVRWHFDKGPLWSFLAACDATVSVFSNTNHDRAQLNRRSRFKPAIPVYLLEQPGMRRVFRDWTGLETLPLSDVGAALEIRARARIAVLLNDRRPQGIRRRLQEHARRALPDPRGAPTRILAAIAGNHGPLDPD